MLGLLILAAGAGAHAAGEWRATWMNGTYTGTMSYSASPTGPTTSVSVNETAGYWGVAQGPIGDFATLALAQHTAMENALNDWANQTAAANNGKAWPGQLTGAITAGIKGLTGAVPVINAATQLRKLSMSKAGSVLRPIGSANSLWPAQKSALLPTWLRIAATPRW